MTWKKIKTQNQIDQIHELDVVLRYNHKTITIPEEIGESHASKAYKVLAIYPDKLSIELQHKAGDVSLILLSDAVSAVDKNILIEEGRWFHKANQDGSHFS